MSATAEQMQAQIQSQLQQLKQLTSAMTYMAACLGTRLNREQMCERLGVHRNTLASRMKQDRTFPRPGTDGRWLLSEVIEWEQRQHQH